jgi:hypothetical protein
MLQIEFLLKQYTLYTPTRTIKSITFNSLDANAIILFRP